MDGVDDVGVRCAVRAVAACLPAWMAYKVDCTVATIGHSKDKASETAGNVLLD